MNNAYAGKLLFVDLSRQDMHEEALSEELARNFVGGYGIGARILYERMKPGVDPLGPDNILGFISGPLNGTGAFFGGRYTVVCKSPVTNGWNDANSGGSFGPELKRAGFDGVFVSGASAGPVFLYINNGRAELRDAGKLLGKSCAETEKALREETGEQHLRAATVGPAGEHRSLMACIINDTHRAAGRGGSGAVMGSKNLKAVAVRGTGRVPVANAAGIREINAGILDHMKNGPTVEQVKLFGTYGTGGMTAGAGLNGDAPVKNWAGSGSIDMGEEALTKLATFSYDGKYKVKKYACAQCPLSCGAHYRVDNGRWPIGETDRPEYETLAAFGTMTLNHDIESIIKCNDICNKSGLDTISVGATVAWAIECYESGLFSREDTGGIELTWGNAEAIVAATQAVADQNGFGKVLAMGSERAAQALGRGGVFLQNVQGIELPMHDPRFSPRFARTYQCDPTPGRHVKGGLGIVDFRSPNEVKYDYGARAQMDADLTCFAEVRNASGSCSFGGFSMPQDALPRLIAAATGWEFGGKDMLQAGKRIFTMRHAFNLREGQRQSRTLPGRCFGETPLAAGPLKGITVDHRTMSEGFLRCMEWDAQTLIPARGLLEDLGGMEDVIRDLYAV